MALKDVKNKCGAKTRSGTSCVNPAMANSRCRMHGGKSLIGIASPTFTTGRYSKNLPTRLLSNYHESLADPQLHQNREDAALLASRTNDLLSRVDSGESGEAWNSLRETWLAGEKALAAWNSLDGTVDGLKAKQTFFETWEAIGILTSEGQADYRAWDEVTDTIESRRKLSDTETKRVASERKTVTQEKAFVFVAAVVDSVKRHVTNPDTLAAIAADLAFLGNVSDSSGEVQGESPEV